MSKSDSKKITSQKKGSNIICRVSNVTPEMVCNYVSRLPKTIMSKKSFRTYMGDKWFQNEHQAPEQWGLYYVDEEFYYPRFNHDITIKEAEQYINVWMKRLIVINPYTRFKSINNNNLVISIVKEIEQDPREHDLKTILQKIIGEEEPLILNEIIVNAINNYSEVLSITTLNKDEEKYTVNLLPNYKQVLKEKYTMTKKEYFDLFSTTSIDSSNLPLQQIFYGAPGTGKSHKVNKEIQNTANALVFRTTFHPDSDYSTFVGAYKPTMKSADRLYSADELIDKLSEIKTLGHTYPCHKFAAKYWYSLKGLSAADIKRIVVACDFPESMTVEVGKGIAIGEEMAKHVQNDKIVYSFVPQAFLKAYVAAWQNPEQPVFLVIEEINRGNCAQIFGDIFQLLDRKDGVSEYPIKADQDIRDYLAKEFAGYDLEANILSGEELVLPANLHIWATMNTSDQSLFPIDSAFKRRWDWKYMPIHDAGENWTIALSDVEYDWWDFVEKINNVIGNMTSSEDKKLGYFFCKACNGKIDAEKFVNKVVFYLWNDVFKDYELSDKAFQDGEGKLTFNKFYTPSGDANESTIKTLMENMGVSTSDLITEIDEEAVNLSKDDLSALQQKRLDFWTRYLKYAQNNADYMQYFGGRQTPTKNYYCQFHVLQKKGYLCVVIKHKANKLFVKYETMDEQLYNTLYSHKAAIESELGDINLTWEGKVGTRERIDIYAEHNVDFNNEQSIFDLIIDRLLRMREVFDKYLNN